MGRRQAAKNKTKLASARVLITLSVNWVPQPGLCGVGGKERPTKLGLDTHRRLLVRDTTCLPQESLSGRQNSGLR